LQAVLNNKRTNTSISCRTTKTKNNNDADTRLLHDVSHAGSILIRGDEKIRTEKDGKYSNDKFFKPLHTSYDDYKWETV
jgi:hypothetical protein